MNDPVLLLWFIPGYIALQLYRQVNPVRSKQGWEWVFQTAFAAILCFVVSRAVLAIGLNLAQTNPQVVEEWKRWWGSQFHLRYSFSLLLGIFPSTIIVAAVLCVARIAWDDLRSIFQSSFVGVPSQDIFFFTCSELYERLVFLTLKSRKVYVGVLIDFTSDPDESAKYIRIMPTISGYRSADDLTVVYNTNYVADADRPEDVTAHPVLIPVAEVTSLSEFDRELHERFISQGSTVIKF
jgi:hypothetical protein